jgi:hypothetical protein
MNCRYSRSLRPAAAARVRLNGSMNHFGVAGSSRRDLRRFPVGTHVDLVASAAALGADNTSAKPRHLGFSRTPHIDQGLMPAGIA